MGGGLLAETFENDPVEIQSASDQENDEAMVHEMIKRMEEKVSNQLKEQLSKEEAERKVIIRKLRKQVDRAIEETTFLRDKIDSLFIIIAIYLIGLLFVAI